MTSPDAAAGERAGLVGRVDRRELLQQRRGTRSELERVERHLVAGVLEQAGHVLDALGVAGRAGCTRPGVDGSSFASAISWKRRLVRADALERHALEELVIGVVGAVSRSPAAPKWRLRAARTLRASWRPPRRTRRPRCACVLVAWIPLL